MRYQSNITIEKVTLGPKVECSGLKSEREFLSLDPMMGDFPGWSPYNYVMCNPIKLVDPDGKAPGFPPAGVASNVTSYCDADGCFKRVSAELWEWSAPNSGQQMGLYSSIGGEVSSFRDMSLGARMDRFFKGLLPEGSGRSNTYAESKRSFVGEGVTVLSDMQFNANGTVGTGAGHARALIFTDDFYTVADAGGIVGDAANAMPLTKFIINMGYSASTGKDAANRFKKEEPFVSPDSTVRNEKTGSYWIYNKEELEKRGRYKEEKN